jgi:hypothetical protein
MKRLIFLIFIFAFCAESYGVELIIKRQANYIHPDPIVNESSIYQRGDVVDIKPDGHLWGKEEHPMTTTYNPPHFFIVKIPGITVEQARKYIQPRMDDIDTTKVTTRRLFKLLADDVPQWVKNSIQTTGEVTVTWAQIKNFVQNKKTGVTE